MKPPTFSLRYFSPAVPLRSWISSYYVFEADAPLLSDTLRAELPQVRFMFQGCGTFSYAGGAPVAMPPAALCGPTTVAVNFVAQGPLKIFGAGLLPAGWAAPVSYTHLDVYKRQPYVFAPSGVALAGAVLP